MLFFESGELAFTLSWSSTRPRCLMGQQDVNLLCADLPCTRLMACMTLGHQAMPYLLSSSG